MTAQQLDIIKSFTSNCKQSWFRQYQFLKRVFPKLTKQELINTIRNGEECGK